MKALYLYKHHPSQRDPLPAERKARFDAGHQIGIRARSLYPGGTDASPAKSYSYRESLEKTKQLIRTGAPVIYEAAFMYEGIIVYCDILIKDNQQWKLAEVKSSNYISETYKEDLAIQHFVVTSSGIKISSALLITLTLKADDTDFNQPPSAIFRETEFTHYCIERNTLLKEEIVKMKWMLAASTAPKISMGSHCDLPYPCDFKGYCSKELTLPNEGLFKSE